MPVEFCVYISNRIEHSSCGPGTPRRELTFGGEVLDLDDVLPGFAPAIDDLLL